MNWKMFIRVFILYSFICHSLCVYPEDDLIRRRCHADFMTELQTWVDEFGSLRPPSSEKAFSLDLSANANPVPALQQHISSSRSSIQRIKYLSLARCDLSRIPPIFIFRYNYGMCLCDTVEYVSFYGNSFLGPSSAGDLYTVGFNATGSREMAMGNRGRSQVANVWSAGFTEVIFPNLKELDLRSCSIQILGENLFRGMPNLRALYISGNEISYIDSTAFLGLTNLRHLDFSRNQAFDENGNPRILSSNTYYVFKDLTNLTSLDLSHTKLTKQNLGMIISLGKSLKSLSLCETTLPGLQEDIFKDTSLEILDVSSNAGILNVANALGGLENKLRYFYANEIGLISLGIFVNFTKLELLEVSHNEINNVSDAVISTLKNLQVLDLNKNRLTAWFKPTYSLLPKLKFLSMVDNNINLITESMIEDIKNVDYVAMSGNFMVCNCHANDFYKMAYKNEIIHNDTLLTCRNCTKRNAFSYYNILISKRHPIHIDCDNDCFDEIEESGRFRLVDYHPGSYVCLLVKESKSVRFADVASCNSDTREIDYDKELANGRNKLLGLVSLPCFFLPLAVMYIFRRRLRYFIITMRNSAMLSLINEKNVIDTETTFSYDVFVSYCNEDRGWVLDHLLPHIEAECSISACLHERDFQVGLSILENIVSCMDRSKSIMLIISQRFLLSQWCQFEMHLAQHRLLETRREDLTLVLLEDIPRRMRPNTLHYLMLTKTYIVWPKDESERHIFWKRLKKTLISQKTKHVENVSLA